MKAGGLIIAFISITIWCIGQQKPIYSKYMYNGLLLNPAYAGSQPQINATVMYRKQWMYVNGSPNTQVVSVHSQLKKRAKRNGLGLLVLRDELGVHSQLDVVGSYAYRLPLSRKSAISLGLQAGFNYLKSDYSKLNLKSQSDPIFDNYSNRTKPIFGAGAYYYRKDKAYVGFSVPYMLKNNIFDNSDTLRRDTRYYYLTGGIVFNLTNGLKFKPSALFRFEESTPLTFDLTAQLLINDLIFVGLTYRNVDAVVFLAQWQATKRLQLGYAYDFTTSRLLANSRGSHEIMLNFRINHTRELCPTYF